MNKITIVKNAFIYAVNEFKSYDYKQLISPILFMFVLYALGIFSIIGANFLYIDDLGRVVDGHLGGFTTSRYIRTVIASFLHADPHINDISPLQQLIAAIFIAASGVILVKVISGNKPSKTLLIASLPVGLSPWFLQCFSYKFDAPYMALSVLASVFPFLFTKNRFLFSACSIISLLVMCMTYQASSGIYILVVIALCLIKWNENNTTYKEIFIFAGISAISYCSAMIIFRAVFMLPIPSTDTQTINLSALQLILYNIKTYFSTINNDMGIIWKGLLLLCVILFILKTVFNSKRNKIISLIVSVLILFGMGIMSYGAYLFLATPSFEPRGILGFGVFIAIISIYLADSKRKAIAIPAFLLCYCFFVFSFAYGNALADQKRYTNLRTEALLHDLSILYPDKNKNSLTIRLSGSIGYSPMVDNIAHRNPIIKRLVVINLTDDRFVPMVYLKHFPDFNFNYEDNMTDDGLDLLLDTRYHIIKGSADKIFVILK